MNSKVIIHLHVLTTTNKTLLQKLIVAQLEIELPIF